MMEEDEASKQPELHQHGNDHYLLLISTNNSHDKIYPILLVSTNGSWG